ncbi:endonuclease/exonuclease/phosphatase family protein [Aurantimonas sp. Leaf443]|uniref:endonuclease/exonuclease/phosphatase family protein n=1 Tax=Aurantimonas sp. Leaf443 TaxID=1736378 RepID=UPI0006FFEE86|nr:endonuclease/exonuclease/phosphatase family protein [Aurantimonas sp. Leaf443]KQT88265.1 hypothetical protein ASG48_02200 [Aurantimonas sp. Leaf443]
MTARTRAPSRRGPAFGTLLGALVALALLALASAILAGFFGRAVWAFDSLSHFRAQLSVLALGAGLLVLLPGFRVRPLDAARLPAAAALIAGAAGLYTVLPFYVAAADAGAPPLERPVYTLLQMNLRYDAADKTPALSRIAQLRPDVVTAQEVTPDWRERLETLISAYPYQYYCGTAPQPYSVGGTAILSRRPFADETGLCQADDGFAMRRIDFNGVVASIVSEHLQWPWPHPHWYQIGALQSVLAALPSPVLIGGDFNAAPWSGAVGTYAEAVGTRPVGGLGPTWLHRTLPAALVGPLGLPIDNILASPQIGIVSAATGEATASDHLPVVVRFVLPERRASPPAVDVVAR